jgi:hypothetical protein
MMDTRRLKNDEWKSAVWDDDERRAFEEGFAAHGKQFHMVSRTVCGWMGRGPARAQVLRPGFIVDLFGKSNVWC